MRYTVIMFLCSLVLITYAQESDTQKIEELYKHSEEITRIEQQASVRQFRNEQSQVSLACLDFDQLYYDLKFNISPASQTLEGEVTGVFKSNINQLDQIKLNFDSREDLTPWDNFAVSGDVSSWSHSDWVLSLDLNKTYSIDDTFSITITYSGLPRPSGFKGFEFNNLPSGDLVISTLSEPYLAQTWWPCKDDPSDKLDSVSVSVTVPDTLIAVSNGLLQDEISHADNTKTYVWKERYPITTYLVSLAISNYATFGDTWEYETGKFMPIDYYVYPHELETAKTAFEPLPQMLTVYSEAFGMYPFVKERYGHAQFEFGGAMEHQTCSSIGRVTESWETIYAHELAHQWFGNMVTCADWHNIWMNEGFATFSEAVWLERAYGKSNYHNYINASLGSITNWGTDAIYRYQTNDPRHIFHRTVYTKGMWVLHMLRHVLGDSIFFEILHDYPNHPDFKHGDVTTEQFRDFCEKKSGRELDWFFQQWIFEPGFPKYAWGYHTFRQDEQNFLFLKIVQEQVDQERGVPVFKMPIDIHLTYTDGTLDTIAVWDSLQTQSFEIPIEKSVQEVQFDPLNWVLKQATQTELADIKDLVSLTSEFQLYQNYPNPFNPETFIPFSIDTSGKVELAIFDVSGRKIRTLVDGQFNEGNIVKWDGTNDDGRPVASGIYISRLKFKDRVQTRKMILVR